MDGRLNHKNRDNFEVETQSFKFTIDVSDHSRNFSLLVRKFRKTGDAFSSFSGRMWKLPKEKTQIFSDDHDHDQLSVNRSRDGFVQQCAYCTKIVNIDRTGYNFLFHR